MLRSLALLAGTLALPAAAAVVEPAVAPPLQPRPGETPAFMLRAHGVQVYQCQPLPGDPRAYTWLLVAPDATLSDGTGAVARLASPNQWESLQDRSSVSAVPLRMQEAGSGNLPWELLRAVPEGRTGLFAGVTSIQRVNTRGGVAPREGCDESHLGREARVAFSADYYFYRPVAAG